MSFIYSFQWVIPVVVWYLVKKRTANKFIVGGFFLLALAEAFFAALNSGSLDVDDFEWALSVSPLIFPASYMLIAYGVIRTQTRGRDFMRDQNVGVDEDLANNLQTLFIPRNETNTFSRAEAIRDSLCERLRKRAAVLKLPVVIQKSQTYSSDVWLRMDIMFPSESQELSLPRSVMLKVERLDFQRFEHILTVMATVGEKTKTVDGVIKLEDSDIECIFEHLKSPNARLKLKKLVRIWPWQLWKPKNKVLGLKKDFRGMAVSLVIIGSVFIPTIGPLIAALIFVIYLYVDSRIPTYVLTSGKPLNDPRDLIWMDSWQANIENLGKESKAIQSRLLNRLEGSMSNIDVRVEKIGYWGLDSWVERNQIVVIHRRAIGYISCESYEERLYVAWESHLNSATWVEENVGRGLDSKRNLKVVAKRVVPGNQKLNEHDVSDANFLTELIHELVAKEIKLYMEEHRIDQEIDFTVQRESRKNMLNDSNQNMAKSKEKKSRFKRLI